MKKILISLLALCGLAIQANAGTWVAADRVSTVGSQLLTKNSISTKITFKVVDGTADNSTAATTKVVYVSSTDLSYAGNDNEVAAVVSHELGHIICNHADKTNIRNLAVSSVSSKLGSDNALVDLANNSYTTNKISESQQEEADVMGATLMINAGYNPLAMVVWITKQPGSTLDTLKSRPCNADRAMNVYDFLTYNYPAKVKVGYSCNEYKTFLTYADPIVTARNSNKKKLAKFNTEQEKAKQTRAQNLAKYKTSGGTSSWGAAYDLLMNNNK
jgi:hypothetical protein